MSRSGFIGLKERYCKRHDAARPRNKRAFTLLELVLAVAILAMISGLIFGVMDGFSRSSSIMEYNRVRSAQVDGMLQLCRRTFRQLPANAELQGGLEKRDGKTFPSVSMNHPPSSLVIGETDLSARSLKFTTMPRRGGGFDFGILTEFTKDESGTGDVKEKWLPLMPEIKDLRWRFYNSRSFQWEDQWRNISSRPLLIELTVQLFEEKEPLVSVFWMPDVVKQQEFQPNDDENLDNNPENPNPNESENPNPQPNENSNDP